MRAVLTSVCVVLLAGAAGIGATPDPTAPDNTKTIRIPGQPPPPKPPEPPPVGVQTLTQDRLFVIDSDVPVAVLSSPPGLVRTSEDVGPIRIRGLFIDGPDTVTSRTYKGKHVITVEPVAAGKVELLVVPFGLTKEGDIVRRQLDVVMGKGPQPPPKPDPKPDPKPVPVVATWIIVVEEKSNRTPEIAAVLNDQAMWRRIEAKGLKWGIYDPNSPDAIRLKYPDALTAKGLTVPAVIALDAAGKVVTAVKLPATAAELENLATGVK